MKKHIFLASLLALLAMASPATAVEEIPRTSAAKETLYKGLTNELACLCGCGTTIASCPHENCHIAVPLREQIKQYINQGLSRAKILTKLLAEHGESLLASPKFSGFNIMAWVTPFLAILLVGFLIARTLKKWVGKKTGATGKTSEKATPAIDENDKFMQKMRKELGDFDE